MQQPQPDDENFTESSASLANAPDEEFAEDKQTAGIVDEAEMEFVQTQYSPRGVVLLYFRGDPAAEVERHFTRTFAELCSGTSANSMEGSHCQGNVLQFWRLFLYPYLWIVFYLFYCQERIWIRLFTLQFILLFSKFKSVQNNKVYISNYWKYNVVSKFLSIGWRNVSHVTRTRIQEIALHARKSMKCKFYISPFVSTDPISQEFIYMRIRLCCIFVV